MARSNRLVSEFYELKVRQLMDKRVWDLPLVEKKEEIIHILNILGARSHIWVINDKETNELIGVITEHDALSILTPKEFPSYVFGMPDIRSIQYGTVKTAEDIMSSNPISCKPDDKIVDALMKMTKNNIRRLAVVEEKKIIGELTLHHLIMKYYAAMSYYPIAEEKG